MRARKETNRKQPIRTTRLEDILVHRGESLPERKVIDMEQALVEDASPESRRKPPDLLAAVLR